MRKTLRHWLWNVCWEIGDTFMVWSFKFGDPFPKDDEEARVRGYSVLDIHKNCIPKSTVQATHLVWDYERGLVEIPQTIASPAATKIDWRIDAR